MFGKLYFKRGCLIKRIQAFARPKVSKLRFIVFNEFRERNLVLLIFELSEYKKLSFIGLD